MVGIVVKPIRLRNSLYLLIPCEVAMVTGITESTRFALQLIHGKQTVLKFEKIKGCSEESENPDLEAGKEAAQPRQPQVRPRSGCTSRLLLADFGSGDNGKQDEKTI